MGKIVLRNIQIGYRRMENMMELAICIQINHENVYHTDFDL